MLRLAPGLLVALSLLSAGCQGGTRTPAPTTTTRPIPESPLETAALAALYNATDGPGWTDSTNWLSDAPVGEWHGVVVDDGGSVIGLDLANNGLSGEIPPELADLANLESLLLNRNQLSGEIPPGLGSLANLTGLHLGGNQLSGEIPPGLGSLARLTDLRLGGNQLSGEIPPELGRLTNLKTLQLAGNQLSGEIPPGLGSLARLTNLRLGGNQLSGEIPPELGRLTNLKTLQLGGNQLSGEIPPELGNLADLTQLRLHENRLSGEIPPELGDLSNLEELGFAWNRLSGTIPPELGNLANLASLSLDWNRLSGTIPPELGDLANLATLSLGHNRLSGELPEELGDLSDLASLSLGHNRLSGELPDELADLVALTALSLDWNELSGAIPPGLVTLPDLADLRLEGNRLSGEIPRALRRPEPVLVAAVGEASRALERRPEVYLEPVFGGRRFERPIELGAYPVGPDGGAEPGLFVAENDGRVVLLRPESRESVTLLDISDRVSRLENEEGLLSVALDPRFEETGHLWLYYTVTGAPHKSRLSRFSADLDDLRRVDPGSELAVLELGQPGEFHHGGAIRFGPDGMLYLGLGENTMRDEAQRLETLWGSVIRIDVRASSEASPYAVPRDNPFVGLPIARPEAWAYGFRNPWRMAFDPATGVLWAGDVGQGDIEEINRVEAGGNYGWPHFEGTRCVNPSAGCDAFGLVPPVVTYGHEPGCAVVGGVVYRGEAVPALSGHYHFADFCSGQLWALPPDGGDVVSLASIPRRVSSFGTDADGEIYVLTFSGAVLRIGAP